ncbi:MAG: ATP-binding protein [Bacteroidaceae bacterium]|nr:ATP-binding protein [Prevotella sp.]MBQ8274141.1 ATP-binding protein [Bacteroidaceae bacterium]
MKFEREHYIKKLIGSKHNHLVKIVTGLRRVGKSYLLFNLYKQHLLDNGVDAGHIIELQLDSFAHRKYRNADTLYEYVENRTRQDTQMYYVMIDEVQMLEDFVDVLNGFLHIDNLDVYVTGSNAKFLSSDIVTEFRGRGVQIHLQPLSFKEIKENSNEDISSLWRDYIYYGGLPMVVIEKDKARKAEILQELLHETYLSDIINRNSVKNDAELEELFCLLASNIGALTNPNKLANTFVSEKKVKISHNTIKTYIDYFIDSFLINKAVRYDIKGKKYIDTPYKYYFADLGLRNALLNFRQVEPTHIMENIIYNHLIGNGYKVDVGCVTFYQKDGEGKTTRTTLEVDFVCNKGSERVYIQSAYSLPDEEKQKQEQRSLTLTDDSFTKIIITTDDIPTHLMPTGITMMNVFDYLLN